MGVDEGRRQELLAKLRSPEHQKEVIAYLKELKGIPADASLPNGTPIITEILRLEQAQELKRCQKSEVDVQ